MLTFGAGQLLDRENVFCAAREALYAEVRSRSASA